ncbi:hypothetical protein [Streptomyces sp. NPDC048442]|uniref:hypothetical protein n=1 Tax=Streptomyces sp. NPDC048442 TaxID=3154823 RepID=UPI00342185B5
MPQNVRNGHAGRVVAALEARPLRPWPAVRRSTREAMCLAASGGSPHLEKIPLLQGLAQSPHGAEGSALDDAGWDAAALDLLHAWEPEDWA